jgi:hypothetical protein
MTVDGRKIDPPYSDKNGGNWPKRGVIGVYFDGSETSECRTRREKGNPKAVHVWCPARRRYCEWSNGQDCEEANPSQARCLDGSIFAEYTSGSDSFASARFEVALGPEDPSRNEFPAPKIDCAPIQEAIKEQEERLSEAGRAKSNGVKHVVAKVKGSLVGCAKAKQINVETRGDRELKLEGDGDGNKGRVLIATGRVMTVQGEREVVEIERNPELECEDICRSD